MSELTEGASEAVRETIERDGVVRNGLARGLINTRALARYIQTTRQQDATLEAIVAAIRRYPIRRSAERYQKVGKLMTKLTMKNRIVDVAVLNDPSIPPALGRFSSEVNYGRGDSFRVVAGVERVKVVIDEKNLNKLLSVLPKKNVKEVVRNLAEIIVSTTEELERTPGVVAAIATELAMNDINNIELMTCNPQIVVVVEERDAMKSYESLQRLMTASQRHDGSLTMKESVFSDQ